MHIGDSNIEGQKGKSFDFVSGEVMRESQLSIEGGQVAEIKGSRELEGLQDESPGVRCSKSRVEKS
jgi:hypothetical protein